MLLWLIFALMTLAVLAIVLAPLLGRARGETARAAFDFQVYRDQLSELETDRDRGAAASTPNSGQRSARIAIWR